MPFPNPTLGGSYPYFSPMQHYPEGRLAQGHPFYSQNYQMMPKQSESHVLPTGSTYMSGLPNGTQPGDTGSGESSFVAGGSQFSPLHVSKYITVKDLQSQFHRTLNQAAQHFGICTTLLKKICRKLKIKKWPYRQIQSVMNRVNSLDFYLVKNRHVLPFGVRTTYEEQLDEMKAKIEKIKKDAVLNDDDDGEAQDLEDDNLPSPTFPDANGVRLNEQASALSHDDQVREASKSSSDKTSIVNSDPCQSSNKVQTHDNTKYSWIANCNICGVLGEYRHPTKGPMLQHILDSGKRCGYFGDSPRPQGCDIQSQANSNDEKN
jgi:hypothetical protein